MCGYADSQKMKGKTFWWWPTDPLMQSIVHSSLSKALVINNIVHTNLSKICRVTSYIWSDTYRRYVSCIGSNVSRYVSYRIIQTIHNPNKFTRQSKTANMRQICVLANPLANQRLAPQWTMTSIGIYNLAQLLRVFLCRKDVFQELGYCL